MISPRCCSTKSIEVILPARRQAPLSPPAACSSPPQPPPTRLAEMFRHFDADGDGKISSHELSVFFASRGEDMPLEVVEAVISELDSDGDRLLDFGDFKRLVQISEGDGHGEWRREDLMLAFEMYEAEKGSGYITPRSLQRVFNQLGEEKSFEECEAMVKIHDLDGNGVIDFDEFCTMMA